MINKILKIEIISAALFVMGMSALRADEIRLRDGKTLQGNITKEDAEEYTIVLGKGMMLRVQKSNVVSVMRSEKKPEPKTIRTIATPAPKAINTSTAPVSNTSIPITSPSTPAQSSNEPVAPPQEKITTSAVFNLVEVPKTEIRQQKIVTIEETLEPRLYKVSGIEFSDIKSQILDPESGKGILVGRRREAFRTTWQPSWRGEAHNEGGQFKWKSAVVSATMTLVAPAWRAPAQPKSETVAEWNAYIKDGEKREQGRIHVYSEALDHFSEEIQVLAASTEQDLRQQTNSVFNSMKERAEKREQGYLRRKTQRSLPVKKP